MRHVIIGNGPAGVVAAETLRRQDPSAEIRLVGREKEPPYSRMAIPYVLAGRIEESGTYLRRDREHFDKLGIHLVRAAAQEVLDDRTKVLLDNGEQLDYDRLLVATGSRPVVPDIKGIDHSAVSHCWTLKDARKVAALARPGSTCVLVGGGFVGCILMEALAGRGVKVTLTEMAEAILPRMMNPEAARMVQRWCETKGVDVAAGARVAAIRSGRNAELAVELDDGRTVEATFVVVSAGVRPNDEFLKGSGIRADNGVLVDDRLRSSVPEVYAAGDCARGPVFGTGVRSVHAVQPTASEHGRVAALNMAGGDVRYPGSLIMNVLDTFGLVCCSVGRWGGVDGGDSCDVADPGRFRYLRLQFEGDRLCGAVSVGRTEHLGVLRGLVQAGVPLGDWKQKLLDDPHQIMEAYIARTL